MAQFKRVLLKLSGEALGGESGEGISPLFLEELAREIRDVVKQGVELGIVIGGGNFFRGVNAERTGMDRVVADHIGMLATLMNSLALQNLLERNGLDSRVMSAIEVNKVCEPYIRRKALSHLEKGCVCIFAAGLGSPYFTTDTAAVLRAIEIKAEAIIKATKVDGVYNKDPKKFKNAKRISELTFQKALEMNVKVMDSTAFTLCQENDLPIIVFNLKKGNIKKIIAGEKIGSIVRR
ncbi:MAG: UMP kinase [Candidatus Wallbacteria bacterium]|nr:UMP kinase [Candidatus Wallbacteria bacterium]